MRTIKHVFLVTPSQQTTKAATAESESEAVIVVVVVVVVVC